MHHSLASAGQTTLPLVHVGATLPFLEFEILSLCLVWGISSYGNETTALPQLWGTTAFVLSLLRHPSMIAVVLFRVGLQVANAIWLFAFSPEKTLNSSQTRKSPELKGIKGWSIIHLFNK